MCAGEGSTNMDRQSILLNIVICMLILLPGVATMRDVETINDELTLYHNDLTWKDAFKFCQDMGDSLAVPSQQEENSVRAKIRKGEHVWVGQYTYKTPWMYPTGCFTSNKFPTRNERNDIATCQRMCGKSDIMLNIYNCLCVTGAPDNSSRQQYSLCKTPCPGNQEEYCGGEGVYTHYTTYTDIKEGFDSQDCGMLEKHSNQSLSIFARHCSIVNTFLCAFYNKTSGVHFYVARDKNGSLLYLPYHEAVESCVRNGTYLADPSRLGASQIPGPSTQYWIGVRRRTIYVTSVNELPKNINNQKCLYMVKGSRGVSKERAKNCSETESCLCRKHNTGRSSFTISIAGTTVDMLTSPTSEITGAPLTNGTSPTVVTSARTRSPLTNGTSPTVVTSEITGSTFTSISTDPVNPDPAVTGTGLVAYIGGGAAVLIAVIIIIIIVIRLTRYRRDKAKLHTDIVPLDTHNYDYLDIMIAENPEGTSAENPEETTGRVDCNHANQATSAECVECRTGRKSNQITDSAEHEAKPLLNLDSSRNMPKSVQQKDLKDKRSNDELYDLADNSVGPLSSTSHVKDSSVSCESQTRKKGPYDYVHTQVGDWGRDPKSECVGNDIYNELHEARTSHTGNSDSVYDHAHTVSDEECYHKLTKPGYKHKEEDSSAYDSTQNTLDSDVYNTLSNKGSKVNGNDTYNPCVETQINPLP